MSRNTAWVALPRLLVAGGLVAMLWRGCHRDQPNPIAATPTPPARIRAHFKVPAESLPPSGSLTFHFPQAPLDVDVPLTPENRASGEFILEIPAQATEVAVTLRSPGLKPVTTPVMKVPKEGPIALPPLAGEKAPTSRLHNTLPALRKPPQPTGTPILIKTLDRGFDERELGRKLR